MGLNPGWGCSFNLDDVASIFKFLFQVALCRLWVKCQIIGDEFLCQYWTGGKVAIFYSFDECIRLRAETCGMEELGQLFFGIVNLDNGILWLCRVTRLCQ